MMGILTRVKKWCLMLELKNALFTIGGVDDKLVRILGKRFLDDWEVAVVRDLKRSGKIVLTGEHNIVSSSTGITYTYNTYKIKQ